MRLTNNHRDHIVNTEKKKKFDDLIEKEKEKLSKEVYKYCLKTYVNKKLPEELIAEGYIRTTDRARVTFVAGKSNEEVTFKDYLPLKVHENWYFNATDRMKEIWDNILKLRNERNNFSSELRTILYAMTTKKQIDASLPELSKYLKDETKAVGMSLIPVEQINKMRAMLK